MNHIAFKLPGRFTRNPQFLSSVTLRTIKYSDYKFPFQELLLHLLTSDLAQARRLSHQAFHDLGEPQAHE